LPRRAAAREIVGCRSMSSGPSIVSSPVPLVLKERSLSSLTTPPVSVLKPDSFYLTNDPPDRDLLFPNPSLAPYLPASYELLFRTMPAATPYPFGSQELRPFCPLDPKLDTAGCVNGSFLSVVTPPPVGAFPEVVSAALKIPFHSTFILVFGVLKWGVSRVHSRGVCSALFPAWTYTNGIIFLWSSPCSQHSPGLV